MKPTISRPSDHEILAERLGHALAAYFQTYPAADWLGVTFPTAVPLHEVQMVSVCLADVGFHARIGDVVIDDLHYHRLVVMRFKP